MNKFINRMKKGKTVEKTTKTVSSSNIKHKFIFHISMEYCSSFFVFHSLQMDWKRMKWMTTLDEIYYAFPQFFIFLKIKIYKFI